MCQRLSFPHNLDNDMMISTVVRFQDEIDCDADADGLMGNSSWAWDRARCSKLLLL